MKNIYILLLISLSTASRAQIINIPDPVFKARLIGNTSVALNAQVSTYGNTADANGDGEIDIIEAAAVTGLRMNNNNAGPEITSLEGIQYFTNLKVLSCKNHSLTALDLSALTNLRQLYFNNNNVSALVLPSSGTLTLISGAANNFTAFNTAYLSNLQYLDLAANNLTSFNTANLPNLEYLNLAANTITSVNIQLLPELSTLDISYNPVAALNLTGNMNLYMLYVNNTLISEIDCSSSAVELLHCRNNPNLTYINVKNNHFSVTDPDLLYYAFSFENLPLLNTICIDSFEQNSVFHSNYNSNGNVTVYTGNNCDEVVNMSTNGVAENELQKLKVYPNPASSNLTIENTSGTAIQQITIYNSIGQLVKVISPDLEMVQADVSTLAQGTYLLNIVSGESTANHKFIKI